MFSIGYTKGLFDLLNELNCWDKINDVYFSVENDFVKSARIASLSDEEENELIDISTKTKLHLVLNGPVWETNYSNESIEYIIKFIKSFNVKILTINNPIIIKLLKEYDVEIKNSVNNKLKTLENIIQWHEMFGLKSFMLDRSLNRNLDELNKIISYCKSNNLKTTLLVNEGCIPDCPYKQFCDYNISTNNVTLNFSNLTCGGDFHKTPSVNLKSPMILPSALNLYDVDVFKIAGRGKDVNLIRKRLQAYLFGNYSISIQHLVDTEPNEVYKLLNTITLSEFDYDNKVKNCKNKCSECDFCDNIFKHITKGRI